MTKKGIIGAGNWLVDTVKTLDRFPKEGELCNIKSIEIGGGGGPCNVLFDLAAMTDKIPLYAAGMIGNDSNGVPAGGIHALAHPGGGGPLGRGGPGVLLSSGWQVVLDRRPNPRKQGLCARGDRRCRRRSPPGRRGAARRASSDGPWPSSAAAGSAGNRKY